MPFKRRYAPKRKLVRRKRLARRPMRMIRSIRQPVQFFKRSLYLSGFTTTSLVSDVFPTYFGTLNQIPGALDFTALYDQYCIKGMKVTLLPRGNSSDIGAGGTAPLAAQSIGVFSVVDYDDGNALGSLNACLQYQNMKMTRSHQIHSRYLKPRLMLTGPTTVGAPVGPIMNTRGWIDVTQVDVPHYGVKFVIQATPNTIQTFDLKVDYYLAFKNVR